MAVVDDIVYRPWREVHPDAGFRWRLGARPLDLAAWFEFGPDADDWIAAKPELLATHRDVVSAFIPGVEAECAEVTAAIVEHLGRHHPDRVADDEACAAVESVEQSPNDLVAPALLVPEDLVLMVERDRGLVFGGGVVCFPNRWDLRSKLGTTLSATHDPVAQLNAQLAAPVDRFFDRLTPQRSFWRLGWGVIDTADGFAPPGWERDLDVLDPGPSDRPSGSVDGGDPVEELFVRVERETIRRFPGTGAVLFTIRTYITPLAALAARSPDDVRAIAAVVASMPTDVAAYKGITPAVAMAITTQARSAVAASSPQS